MRIEVTRQWINLPYTMGTLDNISNEPIELSLQVEDYGIYIYPSMHFKWKDKSMKIRRTRDDNYMLPIVNVVNFMDSTGGADSEGRADAATFVSTPEEIQQMFR